MTSLPLQIKRKTKLWNSVSLSRLRTVFAKARVSTKQRCAAWIKEERSNNLRARRLLSRFGVAKTGIHPQPGEAKMSSTQEGSSNGSSKSKKLDVKRRSWTQQEDLSLINALKEISKSSKYRADNGFKAGYLAKLEELIQASCPETDLKAHPHITSKLSTWKKQYHSLCVMLSRSGVGFSSRGNYMLECEDEQWQQIVKADPHARLMRHKPWPYYDHWLEIFGTDRATGEAAEDIFEAYIDMNKDDGANSNFGLETDNEYSKENDPTRASTDQVSQSCKVDGPMKSKSSSKKKQKTSDDVQGVCEIMSTMNEATNARLDQLASRIGWEYDNSKARAETFDQLGEIPGLSIDDRFSVCELVAMNDKRLDIWRGLKLEARVQYVDHLLRMTRA